MLFKTEDFMVPCGCRSAGECSHNVGAELKALNAMVDAFAAEMKKKLKFKMTMGFGGWDNAECLKGIQIGMMANAAKHVLEGGQEVDIANLAAMIWNQNQKKEG